ncbi:MAG: arginine--tRNA ligase [Oscillospiraceae bacterium]|nr:arginine--tRNA ligase [Oscillospiraceae bacterium]
MIFKNEVAGLVAAANGIDNETVVHGLEVPPSREMGDFAFPCFKLSKELKKSPAEIAKDMADALDKRLAKPEYNRYIASCRAEGGYLNVFINRAAFMEQSLTEISQAGGRYGSSDHGAGKKIVIDYSAPNVAKPFHVGHLCSTAIGGAIKRIYDFLGYETVSVNHIGDWGTQFGKLICAYRRWGDAKALAADTMNELLRVYVLFHKEAKDMPELEDEAREMFLRLEQGEPDIVAQWKEFRDFSITEFERLYKRLGISFDTYDGESFYIDKMGEVVELLEARSLLVESEGARVVDLSAHGLIPYIIIKSDGATIYATRDLAAALYRKRTYDFDKNIYVVGSPQKLHFNQLFTVLGLMGYDWVSDCVHVSFGQVRLPGRKMATREGEIIELEELLDESVKRAAAMIDEGRGVGDPAMVAEAVGVGAIVYAFLKNGRERDMVFKWDEMLDTDGDSGPYLQYTYARASSVLQKAGGVPERADYAKLAEAEEFELTVALSLLPDAIADAADKYEPSILTRRIFGIARAFNKLYNMHSFIDSPLGVREARLHLCRATRELLGTGMRLLGITALEQM